MSLDIEAASGATDSIAETGWAKDEAALFSRIAEDLATQSWSVIPNAIPARLGAALGQQFLETGTADFTPAGIGRGAGHVIAEIIRGDEIRWIERVTAAEKQWLDWSDRLQSYLNRRLYLGLVSFESHFSHYRPGAFYRKHVDAFKAQPGLREANKESSNRLLSLVAYFNVDWLPEYGGELVLYAADGQSELGKVLPTIGTLVIFLSEEVPHEVLPAQRDRFSIAGWFRVNQTRHARTDPPR